MGPTEFCIKRVPFALTKVWHMCVRLIAHLHLPRNLPMPGAIRPVRPYAFMSSQRLPLPLRGINTVFYLSRSRWPRGLSPGSAGTRLLGLRVRIPSGV